MQMKGIVITVDGNTRVEEFHRDMTDEEHEGYDKMSAIVGGMIQFHVFGKERLVLLFNEEGKCMDPPLKPNHRATGLVFGVGSELASSDYIAGDAILFGPDENEQVTSVPERLIRLLCP